MFLALLLQLLLSATKRGGEVMSAHLNEAALEHTHAAPAEVYPQGFAFPSQVESLSARAAHLEHSPVAVPHVEADADAEQPVAVEVPVFSNAALTFKRITDIAIATVCVVLGSPLFLVVALIVRFSSKGPVLFKQHRVGRNGELFVMLKFRTMYCDTDGLLRSDPALWDQYVKNDFKLPSGHSQVTKPGHVLRKLSLDEMPQLWNVLRGDMSVVGVRPVTMEQFDSRPQSTRGLYVMLRPGITGLWQVDGRSSVQHLPRLLFDDQYVTRWSNRRDLAILARTPVAVLKPSRSS